MSLQKNLQRRIYSGDNMMGLSDLRYLPRWVILIIDICFIAISIYISCYIIEKLSFGNQKVFHSEIPVFLIILGISVVFMVVFRTYAGIIRHSTFIDLFKLFLATFSTTIFVAVISSSYYIIHGERLIYMSIPFLVIFFTASFMMMFLFRLFVKEFFHFAREVRRSTLRKRILMLGIDEQSVAMARAITDNPLLPYHIVGFLTQRHDSTRASLLGKPIYTKEKIESHSKEDLRIEGVLLLQEFLTKEEMNLLFEIIKRNDTTP